jgi:hypothetical protein
VSTDPDAVATPLRAPTASACEPYRELITEALQRGRNAMAICQDLVDDHGFAARYASVRRFVVALRGTSAPEARVVITTAPGEDYGKCRVMVSTWEAVGSTASLGATMAIGTAHNGYSASSHACRSLGGRRHEREAAIGVPTDARASRFISRSVCT